MKGSFIYLYNHLKREHASEHIIQVFQHLRQPQEINSYFLVFLQSHNPSDQKKENDAINNIQISA